MNGLFRLCGAALLFTAAAALFREKNRSFSTLISAIASVVLLAGLYDGISAVVSFMKDVTANSSSAGYVPVLLKGIGFVFLSEAVAGICRTAGEERLSSVVRVACRCEILALAIPYLKELTDVALGMLR